jgi:hypothetical protein
MTLQSTSTKSQDHKRTPVKSAELGYLGNKRNNFYPEFRSFYQSNNQMVDTWKRPDLNKQRQRSRVASGDGETDRLIEQIETKDK